VIKIAAQTQKQISVAKNRSGVPIPENENGHNLEARISQEGGTISNQRRIRGASDLL
jgi:hypothetical protein